MQDAGAVASIVVHSLYRRDQQAFLDEEPIGHLGLLVPGRLLPQAVLH